MFFDEEGEKLDSKIPFARRAVLVIATVFTLGFIFKPVTFVNLTQSSVLPLFTAEKARP